MYTKKTLDKAAGEGSMFRLESCSVETLRALAKHPMTTPAVKRKATMIANRKEGLKQSGPTPAQNRARLLANIAFQTAGCLGNIRQIRSSIVTAARIQSDLTESEISRLHIVTTDAIRHLGKLQATAASISTVAVRRLQEKNKEKKA